MIDLQNDPFQKIISWYFLKIWIPEWTFLMICFSSLFLLRKHKKIISTDSKVCCNRKSKNSLILPSSKLTNIPYQSSCTFEVRRFSMISKTLGYVIVSGRVWQSLITKFAFWGHTWNLRCIMWKISSCRPGCFKSDFSHQSVAWCYNRKNKQKYQVAKSHSFGTCWTLNQKRIYIICLWCYHPSSKSPKWPILSNCMSI